MTDDKDRRLLLSLLSTVYNKDIEQEKYMLSSAGDYYIPPHGPYEVRDNKCKFSELLGKNLSTLCLDNAEYDK